jgi:hypothetical protein
MMYELKHQTNLRTKFKSNKICAVESIRSILYKSQSSAYVLNRLVSDSTLSSDRPEYFARASIRSVSCFSGHSKKSINATLTATKRAFWGVFPMFVPSLSW